jgi:hypothetical protein
MDAIHTTTGSRALLASRIEKLAKRVLPAVAKTMRYPVTEDHCFLRIAYDQAVQGMWYDHVESPFGANATKEQMQRALDTLREMVESATAAHRFNRQSLAWRDKL